MSCTYDQDGVLLDDQTGAPCGQTIGPGNVYGGTVYGGSNGTGSGVVNGTLNTVLQSILSGVALFKRAPYVPTSNNPYNQAPPTIVTGLGGLGSGGSGNLNNSSITAGTVGKVEAWIKKNPGVSAMIAGAVILFYAKPPQRGR